MSETTPDPADVHTSTDRVELTDAERDLIVSEWDSPDDPPFAAVESIVAARVAALTAERDRLQRDIDTLTHENATVGVLNYIAEKQRSESEATTYIHELQAELAAANARCAELEAHLVRTAEQFSLERTKELAQMLSAASERAMQAEAMRDEYRDARTSYVDDLTAERDALQARLDRMTAESSDQDRKDVAAWLLREADKRTKFFPQRVDGVDALMRRLAEFVSPDLRAALSGSGTKDGSNDE